jgi:hypothetical protein
VEWAPETEARVAMTSSGEDIRFLKRKKARKHKEQSVGRKITTFF